MPPKPNQAVVDLQGRGEMQRTGEAAVEKRQARRARREKAPGFKTQVLPAAAAAAHPVPVDSRWGMGGSRGSAYTGIRLTRTSRRAGQSKTNLRYTNWG